MRFYLCFIYFLLYVPTAHAESFMWAATNEKYMKFLDIKQHTTDPLLMEIKRSEEKKKQLVGEFVAVPAGVFRFGNISRKQTGSANHLVPVKGFELGKYEVTQDQWKAVMGSNPSQFSSCDKCPVERVSWNDIQKYLEKLNQMTGEKYRLPTEVEWEYSCRSGGKNEKYCGGNSPKSLAWYDMNSFFSTHPVGKKRANGLGLYDMSGNVWEWVQDCRKPVKEDSSLKKSAYGSSKCRKGVLRGGSWYYWTKSMTSTNSIRIYKEKRENDYGFRLARDN